MVKKKENLLAFSLICLAIAFTIEMLGNNHVLINFVALGFIFIAILTNSMYIVELSLDKKKK